MRSSLFSRVFHGQILSLDFFVKNWLLVLTGLVLIMMYITNKYNTKTKMEEVRALKTELQIVKTERIRVRSDYMSRIRESGMQELVDSFGLGLTIRERPPFSVTND